MDTYAVTFDYISNQPVLKEWEEARLLVEHAAALRPRDWQLPIYTCHAVGGQERTAIPACAALACAQIAIVLIDDMLDQDPRGEYLRLGPAATANFAAALLAAGSESIFGSLAASDAKLASLQSLSRMLTSVSLGQFLDVQNRHDEESYWRTARLKSGSFFRAAFELGALFGGASQALADAVGRLGLLYGEMIQIHDDLGDCMATPASPDWLQKRSPLPILFAETVEHPDQDRFLELRQRASEADALCEAQSILIRCGAISYCVDQLLTRSQSAEEVLANTSLAQAEQLHELLEGLVVPVRRLLKSAAAR